MWSHCKSKYLWNRELGSVSAIFSVVESKDCCLQMTLSNSSKASVMIFMGLAQEHSGCKVTVFHSGVINAFIFLAFGDERLVGNSRKHHKT